MTSVDATETNHSEANIPRPWNYDAKQKRRDCRDLTRLPQFDGACGGLRLVESHWTGIGKDVSAAGMFLFLSAIPNRSSLVG